VRAVVVAPTAEQQAVEQREERRRRREAGLPEQTRGERLRGGLSGFGARLAEPRYLAVVFVVLVAVAGGVVYLVTQGSDSADGRGGHRKQATHLKRSEIEVTVLNGTAVPGLAGTYGEKVERKGFRLGAVTNSSTSFADSVVMFERGHAPEARRVAAALEIPESRLMTASIAAVSAGAPVAVVVGEDNASTEG
jgi:hypothetical protein